MVVFTCQHCGSSVSKTKVEKHYSFECRNDPFVTCVDCLKDFRGDEYVAHTQCVTEEERYAPKGFVAKTPPSVKKRATWLNSVECALDTPSLTQAQRNLIQALLKHSNIPQKKKKFQNFIKSAFGRQYPDEKLIDSVFDILEETHKRNLEKEKAENDNKVDVTDNKEDNGEENGCDSETKILNNSDDNGDVEKNDNLNCETSGKKKKKKNKKNRSKSESEAHETSVENDNSFTAESKDSTMNGDSIEENVENHDNLESDQKLSKKEKKEKKKRAKYEAELNEIQNCKICDDENVDDHYEENGDDAKEKSKKKKKKDKNKNADENGEVNVVNGANKNKKRPNEETNVDVVEEPNKKKSKSSDSENLNESIETNNVEKKFNWSEAIVNVLESRSDKELPVNRLCKKIINEYQAIHGENHMTYEKLLSKFNKKLHKIPNVKVLKDKAKLIT